MTLGQWSRWRVAAACAVVAAIPIGYVIFGSSDEDKVRGVVDRFAKAVAVKPGDNVLSRGARINSELKDIVEDNVHASVLELGMDVDGRKALVKSGTQAGVVFQSATVELSAPAIQMDDAHTTASVDATASLAADRNGKHEVDKRQVHFFLRKDGSWKISTIEVFAPSKTE